MDVKVNVYMLEPLLSNCKNLTRIFTNSIVTHIFKDANRWANSLTKLGVVQWIDFLILNDPSLVVAPLLAFDKAELFCNRLVYD